MPKSRRIPKNKRKTDPLQVPLPLLLPLFSNLLYCLAFEPADFAVFQPNPRPITAAILQANLGTFMQIEHLGGIIGR